MAGVSTGSSLLGDTEPASLDLGSSSSSELQTTSSMSTLARSEAEGNMIKPEGLMTMKRNHLSNWKLAFEMLETSFITS